MDNEIKLPDSGATVRVKRISPMSLMAIEQAYPDPRPPLQEVDYGGKTRQERNPLDPDYQLELAEHARKKNMLILKAIVRLGVACEFDTAAVAAYRESMTALGITLDPDDLYIFVAHILCASNTDLETLRNAVLGESIPTEKAVADKQAAFPSDLQAA